MAGEAIGAGIGAGSNIVGGAMDMQGQMLANAREGRLSGTHAGNLNDLIDNVILNPNTAGLENAAQKALTVGGNQLDATLAGRGVHNSGMAINEHRALQSDVMSNLAQQINQDQVQRAGLAANVLQNPSFGFYDRAGGGGVTNQGK